MTDYKGDNIFEKMAAFIPGYKGYSERKGRRDTDKILRDEIAGKLGEKTSVLDGIIRNLTSKGRLDSVDRYDRLRRKITSQSDQIRYATYGASGFFDAVQVRETTLDKLYSFDLGIRRQVDKAVAQLDQLAKSDKLEEDAGKLESILDELANQIKHRENLITEVK